MYSGFVYDRETGPRFNKIGSLAWTNGLAVAVPMLFAANRLNDDTARRQSLAFIENVVQNSFNTDSGLLYDAVENELDSRNNGSYICGFDYTKGLVKVDL